MRHRLDFDPDCWAEEYTYWELHDVKMIRKIHRLLDDIDRNGHEGIGKPEPLRHNLHGWWSRRITEAHRLVYRFDDDFIHILHCRNHYND